LVVGCWLLAVGEEKADLPVEALAKEGGPPSAPNSGVATSTKPVWSEVSTFVVAASSGISGCGTLATIHRHHWI